MKGFIVICHSEIEKSTIVEQTEGCNNKIINFESNVFDICGVRDDDWEIVYCRQAVSLAKQGFIVLVSPSLRILAELSTYKQDDFNIVTIAPFQESIK